MNLVIGPNNYDVKTYDFVNVDHVLCLDHLGGFDENYKSTFFDEIVQSINKDTISVATEYILPDHVVNNYPRLNFKFDLNAMLEGNRFSDFFGYKTHPVNKFNNFICSFNGSPHVSRKLLASILYKFGHFNAEYSSKNFTYTVNQLVGHVMYYTEDQENFYSKFFISDNSEEFFQTVYSFGHNRFEHGENVRSLENKLTESFIHVVSETLATSYVPFVTEKFLYSVVTRGLFVSYAQPGWHEHVEKYYGFKKYNKLFDYRFDTIQNPVERLVELMAMISKFSHMSTDDWRGLYEMEHDTIEYNYDRYFSGDYIKSLEKYA